MEDGVTTFIDVYEAAAIFILTGINPSLKLIASTVIFEFPNDECVRNAVSRYHAGAAIPAVVLSRAVRQMRAKMWGVRTATSGGG